MTRTLDPLHPGESRPGTSSETPPARDEIPAHDGGICEASPTSHVDSRDELLPPEHAVAPRCDEKGCVFPVAGPGKSKCLNHSRAENEPEHFECFQPTVLVLDRARFGLPDPETEPDDSKARDRRREVTERQEFFEESA